MSTMIPASSITATLTADLSYNPSIHVQTVEIDRTGTGMLAMATNNFVKWYITLRDFQNLTYNIRDLPGYSAATDNDQSQNIFAFARPETFVYGQDAYNVQTFDDATSGAEYAESGSGTRQRSGVVLTQEASGGAVKFSTSSLTMYVPLATDSPTYGNTANDGTQALVGATTVTYDRVLLDENATTDISSSTRTSASSTTTTWSFVDSSFGLTVNWAAAQTNTTGQTITDFSFADGPTGVDYAGSSHWGRNVIHVYASTGATINVTKPYNDAAADFIQIGMDASGSSSTYASGVGTTTSGSGGLGLGTTTYGVAAGDVGGTDLGNGNTDAGLVDPISANGMSTSSADVVTDSVDFGAYLSDYTATHNDTARNLINVQIGKPTLQITETAFTKALQNAIDQDGVDVRDVSNTQSLRYAVRDAFLAGHLRGFQCGAAANTDGDQNTTRAGAIELELPLTVAGQERKTSDDTNAIDTASGDTTTASGSHKKVYLTPIIELVSDNYYHPSSWYTYRADA